MYNRKTIMNRISTFSAQMLVTAQLSIIFAFLHIVIFTFIINQVLLISKYYTYVSR